MAKDISEGTSLAPCSSGGEGGVRAASRTLALGSKAASAPPPVSLVDVLSCSLKSWNRGVSVLRAVGLSPLSLASSEPSSAKQT